MPREVVDERNHSILKKLQIPQLVYAIVGWCAWTLANKEAGGSWLLILNLSTRTGYQSFRRLQVARAKIDPQRHPALGVYAQAVARVGRASAGNTAY